MNITVSNYTFDASAQTITFNDYTAGGLYPQGLKLITNLTDNVIIYNFADPLKGGTVGGASNNVLTLTYDTTSMDDADILQIIYDDLDISPAVKDGWYYADGVSGGALTAARMDTPTDIANGYYGALRATSKRALHVNIRASDGSENNEFAPLYVNDVSYANGQGTMAASKPVVIASDQSAVAVTEANSADILADTAILSGAVNSATMVTRPQAGTPTLADGTTNAPSVLQASSGNDMYLPTFPYAFNGTTWDRVRGDATNGLTVNLGTNNDITGSVTANAGTNLNTSALAVESGGNLAGAATSLAALDNAVDGNYLNVNMNVAGTDAVSGSGTATGALRVELANNGTGLVGLNAGTNAIGKLLAPDIDITTHTNYARKYYTSAGAATDGIIWSPAAGKRWHVVTMYIQTSAAATVTLEDDKAGGDDPIWKAELAANSGAVLSFTEKYPMASGEDAADLTVTTSTGNIYITCVGYEV